MNISVPLNTVYILFEMSERTCNIVHFISCAGSIQFALFLKVLVSPSCMQSSTYIFFPPLSKSTIVSGPVHYLNG